jgi:predicted phosphohydrolase
MSLLKFLWYTDTHLDKLAPWTLISFIRNIVKIKPAGVFLTGDISTGPLLSTHLKLMAHFIPCPIYFVLGNHDYHLTSFEKQHDKIRSLCQKYPNLIWVTDTDLVPLNEEVALIGVEGWYDAQLGNPKYIQFTPDWLLIEDFKPLTSLDDKLKKFRKLSHQSCKLLEHKLEQALEQDYKKIYILTHFPPWKEATRDEGTLLEPLYLPYNVNLALGQTIENVMAARKKRSVDVYCGHTHHAEHIHVSRNIRCQVGEPNLKCHILYA